MPDFVFKLSTALNEWLMAFFRLQKVKEVCKIYYTPEKNWLKGGFLYRNVFLNIIWIHKTIFITSFRSAEISPWTVTFHRYDTPILPHTILLIFKQNDVISWQSKLWDDLKIKEVIKEIERGFLIIWLCRLVTLTKFPASSHL